ncbi:MAG: 4-alpha-glucanotransferase [Tannerella sp.]|jgi:4-alpha-glucanotransferase|nr:4-alpha-glucanotransferase [Tannerella sp.]
MNVTFHIEYRAGAGKKLCLAGPVAAGPEEWPFDDMQEMQRQENDRWMLQLTIPPSIRTISYRYLLVDAGGNTVTESWERGHRALLDPSGGMYHLYDYWLETPPDMALYSAAFTKAVYAHTSAGEPEENRCRTLVIRVSIPRVEKNRYPAIAGNQACLGFWQPEQAKEMNGTDFPEWEVRLNADEITFPLEYKFLLRDERGRVVRWETGENRILEPFPPAPDVTVVVSCFPYRESLPAWKGAGTAIPVFSLRSEQSFGIGDLHDLKLLINWAEQTNQRLVQILPVNDTTRTHTWADSYPYSAVSIYALHPLYISLTEMGALKEARKRSFYRRVQQALNAGEEVDYEAVEKHKISYCRDFFAEQGASVLASDAFRTFWETAQSWLAPYASFCYYRDKYRTADFTQWGEHAVYRPEREPAYGETGRVVRKEIAFTYFLQFVLHTQFKAVSEHARRKGIILKGDLPIGIHRTSVEAWTEATLFNENGQAGAPPDNFSDKGQNWSFPTYHWDVMERDGFAWWKKRLRALEHVFTALRIDHLLGFFRIWEIPIHCVDGLCGHFRPALPFTAGEIEDRGLPFRDAFLQARIRRSHAVELLGETFDEAVETYLSPDGDDHLTLKPCCNTQRKTDDLFRERTDPVSLKIKAALFTVAANVLFLADPYEPAKYHPRISASGSFAYKELTPEEQLAFDRLSFHFFYERHNAFWKEVALKRLTPLIHSTDMLICGEDLGMIPDSVHEVMDRLHILSLELERAPKLYGLEFADLQQLPYLSVCTTSTHDMPPLRSWWNEVRERTQRYYRQVLHGDGTAPAACSPERAGQILRNHLNASSMLTIIPLQDWLALSGDLRHPRPECERINIPADPHHYWRYRMHLSLETLAAADDFNRLIRRLIAESGRDDPH